VNWGDFDFADRRRAPRARADLLALGASGAEIDGLPLCGPPVVSSSERAWGALYVLEGSTLGGRIIRRELQSRLGPQIAQASAFFDGRAGEGGPLWRSFLQALEQRVRTPAERSAAQAGAERTFQAMIDWFAPAPAAALDARLGLG
jgi:heme oxygenase